MKTIKLNLTENALNNDEILAQEVAMFLSKNSTSNLDYEADGKEVIEYDLTETVDPIYWTIGEIKRNDINFTVNLFC